MVETDDALTGEQLRALEFLVKSEKVAALAAKAGTGKSRLTRTLYHRLAASCADGVLIVTPSHKAAARLREFGLPATTIQSGQAGLVEPVWHEAKAKVERFFEAGTGKVADFIDDLRSLSGLGDLETGEIEILRGGRSLQEGCEHLKIDVLRTFLTDWAPLNGMVGVIIIDEAGMTSLHMARNLHKMCRKLVLVGDDRQLWPVADDRLLAEDKAHGVSALRGVKPEQTVTLEHVHRTGGGSDILRVAEAVLTAATFSEAIAEIREIARQSDAVFVAKDLNGAALEWLTANGRPPLFVYRNYVRKTAIMTLRKAYGFPADDIAVGEELLIDYVPGDYAAQAAREAFAEFADDDFELARPFGLDVAQMSSARVREPLVRNMTVEVVRILDRHQIELRDLFGQLHTVRATVGEYGGPYLRQARGGFGFVPAVALTVHKSQGSEWPAVTVHAQDIGRMAWLPLQGGMAVWRRALYTAVTRAMQRLLLIIG